MEEELENLMVAKMELERDKKNLLEKTEKIQSNFLAKSKELETVTLRLKNASCITNDEVDALKAKLKEIETDNETLKARLREREQDITDLTNFYHKTLEELAIAGSELESVKNKGQEDTQRLRDCVNELTQELEVVKRPCIQNGEQEQPPPEKDFKCKFDVNVQSKDALDMIDSLILTISSSITEYQTSYKLK